ncbi:MAG: toprim domain-containing protein [Methylococcales bacterium]
MSVFDLARAACARSGIIYKDVPADGAWHLMDLTDDPHKGRGDGRLRIFLDMQGGDCWNHKTGQHEQFFLNRKRIMTATDKAKVEADKARRQAEISAGYERAARKACALWQNAKPVTAQEDHKYLLDKNVQPPIGLLKITTFKRLFRDVETQQWKELSIKNTLLVPLFDESKTLKNVQLIYPRKIPQLGDRNKDFLAGGPLNGLFCWVGKVAKESPVVCVCEGLATALSVHKETSYRTYITFSAGNLKAVGLIIRKRMPDVKIIFCADNDRNKVGLLKANDAALAVDGYVCHPPLDFIGDFNDFANAKDETAHG